MCFQNPKINKQCTPNKNYKGATVTRKLIPENRALVDDVSGDSLSNFDSVAFFDKIAIHRSTALLTFHGFEASHTAVLLKPEKRDSNTSYGRINKHSRF